MSRAADIAILRENAMLQNQMLNGQGVSRCTNEIGRYTDELKEQALVKNLYGVYWLLFFNISAPGPTPSKYCHRMIHVVKA